MILLDEETLTKLREEYYDSHLFCTLVYGLSYLQRLYGELPPTQVWHEVVEFCAHRLERMKKLEYEVLNLYNCLLERYRTFETPAGEIILRSANEAAYTTVCVLTCVCFRLVSEPEEAATLHSQKAIVQLLKLIGRHPVHSFLYQEQRIQEESLERDGKLIERTPWFQKCSLPKPEPDDSSLGASVKEDRQLVGIFHELFKDISLDDLLQWVALCEEKIFFKNRIDRIAYLVSASQNGWLKKAKSLNVSAWVKLMNAILGPDKAMQASEVNRKWKDLRFQKFAHQRSDLDVQLSFQSKNISLKFFDALKDNVLDMPVIKNVQNK